MVSGIWDETMLFQVQLGDMATTRRALDNLDVRHFAAAHSLTTTDLSVLTHLRYDRSDDADGYDHSAQLDRAVNIISGASPLLTAVRTSFFAEKPATRFGPMPVSPIGLIVAHVVAERERVRFYESPHSGISRDTDLRFKALAFAALGFVLQVSEAGNEAEQAYDLAQKSSATIPEDETWEGFAALLETCRHGQWDEFLYYKLCGDFPGFIQARIRDAEKLAQNGELDAALDHLLKANTAFHADRARGLVHLAKIVQKMERDLPPMGDAGHTRQGIDYGKIAVKQYASSRDWPYVSTFVTPFFFPHLSNLQGQKVLDVGCGVGLWSVYAAINGGKVYGLDFQPSMIEEASKIMRENHVQARVTLDVGDAAALPYPNDFFDKAISINVACNLSVASFEDHFKELSRTLQKTGTAIVMLPDSLDKVFSDGSKHEDEIRTRIGEALAALNQNPGSAEIVNTLNGLKEVLSATFALQDGRLILVTDVSQLREGQEVWRKLPNVTIPNRFHSEAALMEAVKQTNLRVERIDRPRFATEKDRLQYNRQVSTISQLGGEYVSHPPFVILQLGKNNENE